MRQKNKLLYTTLTAFILASGAHVAQAQDTGPFDISAKELIYDSDANSLKATGRIEVSTEDSALWADEIYYNLESKKLIAKGNITLLDDNGFTVDLSEIELDGELKTAVLSSFQARVGEFGPTLIAKSAEKTAEGKYVMHNASYSACPQCTEKSKLPWKIRAKKITYNPAEQNMTYKNATLELMSVPILYTPYFKHAVGDQVAQSGLLTPRFGRSTSRGEEITLGYYYRHADNEDYTFRTRFMSQRGTQFQAERRHIGERMSSEINMSVIEDDRSSTLRSHVDVKGEYTLAAGRRIGLNSQIVSDDTYLDDYFGENPSFLPSTLYYEDADKDHYFTIYGTRYHDLREQGDPGRTAKILPRVQFEKLFELNDNVTRLTLNGDVLALHRDEGQKSQRMIGSVEVSQPYITNDGQKIDLSASIRGDVYHIDSNIGDDDTPGRILPQIAATWEKPYVSKGGRHTIAPKAMVVAAPAGGNPDEITNEDSVAYELDTSNLLQNNRFAGLDRVETGTRAVYGLENRFRSNDHEYLRFFFGQSYRFNEDSVLPNNGGTETKMSDWVGSFDFSPTRWIETENKFRLDNSDFTAKRLDSSLRIGEFEDRRINIGYSFLDGGPEEINMKGRFDFTEAYSIRGEVRKDLTDDGKILLSQAEFVYTHACYRSSFKVRRRGFTNRNVPPSTDYLFNIELLTLGREDERPSQSYTKPKERCYG